MHINDMIIIDMCLGRYVSGLSRDLETLGSAARKIATCHHSSVRIVRGRRGGHAAVRLVDRLVQLGGAVLRVR